MMGKIKFISIITVLFVIIQVNVYAKNYTVTTEIINGVVTTIYYFTGDFKNENIKSTFNLLPDEQPLSLSSQIKLNGVNIGEEGLRIADNATLNCTLNVSNSSQNDDAVTVILATYTESKKLHGVKVINITVPGEGSCSAELSYEFDAENEKTATIMYWDSMNNMLPIKTSVDFSYTSGVNAYCYDLNNRLIQVDKKNGKSIRYDYDQMGNLLSKTVRGAE